MANELLVSMKFQGVDNVSPEVKKITDSVGKIGNTAKEVSADTKRMNDEFAKVGDGGKVASNVKEIDTQIKSATDEIKKAEQAVKDANAEMNKIGGGGKVAADIGKIAGAQDQLAFSAGKVEEGARKAGRSLKDAFSNALIQSINGLNDGFNKASKFLDDMHSKADALKAQGLNDILTGYGMGKPIVNALDAAGGMQTGMITIAGATGATPQEQDQIMKAIHDASNVTKYGSSTVMQDIAVKEATSGFSADQIAALTPTLTKFAEVQDFSKGTSPSESVTDAISASHMLGVYDVPGLENFLNNFNKATQMQPGSTSEFFDTFKYAAPIAKGMNLSNDDIIYTSALANRVGFLGSMGGTETADMILRSIPGIFGGEGHVDKKTGQFVPSKQMKAMMDLGLASVDKNNKVSTPFFDSGGNFKGIENFIDLLANASKKVNPEELTKDFKDMFGLQGEKLAVVLSERGGEQLQLIQKQMEAMKSTTDLQEAYNKSYEGQLAQFETNLQNLNQDVGNVLLPVATDLIHTLQPYVDEAGNFIQTHQQEVEKVAEVVAAVSAFALATGAAKLAIGGLGSFITPILKLGTDLGSVVIGAVKAAMPKKIPIEPPVEETIPEQVIRASVVNVYGAEINGGGAGGGYAGGGGTGGKIAKEEQAIAKKVESEAPSVITSTSKAAEKPIIYGPDGKTPISSKIEVPEAPVVAPKIEPVQPSKITTAMKAGGGVLKGVGERAKVALPVTVALDAYDIATAPEGEKLNTSMKAAGSVAGGWAGAEAGAAMGAAIGSVVPGLGTAIGALLGGIIGSVAGSTIGEKIASSAMDSFNSVTGQINGTYDTWVKGQFAPTSLPTSFWTNQNPVPNSVAATNNNKTLVYNDNSTNNVHSYLSEPASVVNTLMNQKQSGNMGALDFLNANN